MRKATLHRKTAETEIRISLTIEGRGKYRFPLESVFSTTCWNSLLDTADSI